MWLGDERIAAGTVVWAAGVQASPLGASLGAPVRPAGRVEVETDLSVPGHPEVFVAGDLMLRPGADGRPIPGVAQAAMQAGRAAAANALRRARRASRPSRSATAIPATWRRSAAPGPSPTSAGSG